MQFPSVFLVNPALHVFRHTPEESGDAPVAFVSVVLHVAARHSLEKVLTDVPASAFVIVHIVQTPFVPFVNPGSHMTWR
jgi:nucleoside recognition membrane protein YjiH